MSNFFDWFRSRRLTRRRPSLERLEDRLAPATHTWTGAANDGGLWSTAANWQADFAPAANEADIDLVFPSGPAGDALTSTNDLVFANGVRRIDVSGTGYQIGGVGITLLEAINGVGTEVGLDVTLGGDARLDAVSVTGGIDLNGNALSFGTNEASIGGVVSGDGEVRVAFANVTLSGDNTFTGPVSIGPFGGIVTAAHANALGATGAGNDTVISFNTNDLFRRGGELRLTGGIVVPEDVVANGQGTNNGAVQSIDGDNTLTGTITGTASFSVASGTQLTLERVAGTGLIVGAGGGTLRLAGTQANTYTGLTAMAPGAGTLLLDKPAGVAAIPGGRVLVNSATTLRSNADDQIGNDADIDVRSGLLGSPGGVFDLNGRSDAIGSLGGAGGPTPGEVRLGEGELSVLDSAVEGGTGEFAGRLVGGSDSVFEVRGERFRFAGDGSDFLGTVEVTTGGVLDVQTELTLVGLRGGTLQGTGSVNFLAGGPEGGVVSPGNSPGTLSLGLAALGREIRLLFEVLGSSSPSQRDKIVIGETLNINNAVLEFLFENADGFQVGDVIVVAQTDPDNEFASITGEFADLPDGTVFQAGGKDLRIGYANDKVTLTVVEADDQRVATTTAPSVVNAPGNATTVTRVRANVVAANGAVVNGGSVTFFIGNIAGPVLDTQTAPVVNGVAEVVFLPIFRVEDRTLVAEYTGDATFAPSRGEITIPPASGLPTTILAEVIEGRGRNIEITTIRATVSSTVPFPLSPTGTVEFRDRDGTVLARLPLEPDGTVTFGEITRADPNAFVGVTATYSGDAFFNPSNATASFRSEGDPPTPNEQFVSEAFQALLGRPVDPVGLEHFTGLLDRGEATMGQVAGQIQASPEGLVQQVTKLYREILERAPDAVGLAAHVAFLQNGGTLDELRAIFLGSQEFFDRFSGGTNEGFLRSLFETVLGREIDPAGADVFGLALRSGVDRVTVAMAVIESLEGRTVLTESLYNDLLGRPSDEGGLASHVDQLLDDVQRVDQLIAAFVGSEEFAQKAQGD